MTTSKPRRRLPVGRVGAVLVVLALAWHGLLVAQIWSDGEGEVRVNPITGLVTLRVEREQPQGQSAGYQFGQALAEGFAQLAGPGILERELNLRARRRYDLYAMLVDYRVVIEVDDEAPADPPPIQLKSDTLASDEEEFDVDAFLRSREKWHPPDQPVAVGDVQVTVRSVELGRVTLEQIFGGTEKTRDSWLRIALEIEVVDPNLKAEYRPWGGYGGKAALRDDFGNDYDPRYTGIMPTDVPAGGVLGSEALYPGRPVRDVLLFEPPLDTASFVQLELSAERVGGSGTFRFQIPASAWKD